MVVMPGCTYTAYLLCHYCTPAVMPCMAANATSLPAAALQNKLRKTSVPAYISACWDFYDMSHSIQTFWKGRWSKHQSSDATSKCRLTTSEDSWVVFRLPCRPPTRSKFTSGWVCGDFCILPQWFEREITVHFNIINLKTLSAAWVLWWFYA